MIHSSGIGVYLKHMIPFLTQHFEVTVLGKEEELSGLLKDFPIAFIPVNSPIYSLKEQLELFSKVPPSDVFWSPQYNIPLLPVRARKRVVTIHDTYHLAYKHTLSVAQKAYATVLLNSAVRLSDRVFTVSEFSKKEIIKYTKCPQDKIKVIYNGVDENLFNASFSENEVKTLRSTLPSLPENYILYVGNVKPHKNLITLLKAYAGLSPSIRDTIHLVIVGKKEGFLTPEVEVFRFLESQPHLQSCIHFTGFVPDGLLPLLYKCASLSVFPSVYEGFGLPPLEAMASGCPVIASNAASIPEVCAEAALYFDALDVEGLKSKMEYVLLNKDIRADLSKKGLKHSSKFSWLQSAEKHRLVLEQLLSST
ncbi:glycosyltransferase family 4 protein [Sabulibacter ruber]|uniref:glycosyltransferase family 4 protein n=1 Tax=Sabulibacter ruber TaxID=2811901 RepID=UPI001A9749EF|nr:glycosyltransferase family 1 protein [Sabulibacter ruber]